MGVWLSGCRTEGRREGAWVFGDGEVINGDAGRVLERWMFVHFLI
jgi:hypothetical protein